MKQLIFGLVALTLFCSTYAQDTYETPQLKEQIKKLDLAHAQAIFKGNAFHWIVLWMMT
jgi:hypothetical protein